MTILKTPFKFLDSYQKEDYDIFFGREKEIEGLYHALSGVKHLLVYGPSGAGKTSLVECGLRNQFSDADWFALTIRRRGDMMASFYSYTNEHLSEQIPLAGDTRLPIEAGVGFGQAIERLFEERYQPVYLLFDQFEELLIQGGAQEKIDFFTSLNELIRYKVPCRVILIMREEFIGYLSEYEHLCPSIFQHRFRLEKMNKSHVRGMLVDTLTAPSLQGYFSTADPGALADGILSRIPDDKFEIELAHVQVFLTELWQRALALAEEGALPGLHLGLVRPEDQLEGILDNFLKDQLRDLLPVYGEKAPLEVLVAMISERYTKLQVSLAGLASELERREVALPRPLIDLVRELVERKILRATRSGSEVEYEISHDVLALVVGRNQTEEMKLREEAAKVYSVYEGRAGMFSREDMDHMRPYQRYKACPPSLQRRIEESEAFLQAAALRAQQEKEAELERQKAIAEQEAVLRKEAEIQKEESEKAKRRATWFAWGAVVLAVLGVALAVFAYGQSQVANREKKKAQESAQNARIAEKSAIKQKWIAEAERYVAKFNAEELRKQKAIAEQKSKESNKNEVQIRQELAKTQVAREEVMRVILLQKVDILIKQLQYDEALKEMYNLIPLGVLKDSLALALLEPAFWYGETGNQEKAWNILDMAYQLLDRRLDVSIRKDSSNLQAAFLELDTQRYNFLKLRYYPEMVNIKGGESRILIENRGDGKKRLVSDFKIAKTETTWWQYAIYVASESTDGKKVDMPQSPGWGISGDNPVVNVTWLDAIKYMNWLSRRMGIDVAYRMTGERVSWGGLGKSGYRLPTEIEWEYAASGGKLDKFAGTDNEDSLGDYAWYKNNKRNRTHPVEKKSPNAYGLYDMSGNVWEWCWNFHGEYGSRTQVQEGYRVIRGGGWSSEAKMCRIDSRSTYKPDIAMSNRGFRVVRQF